MSNTRAGGPIRSNFKQRKLNLQNQKIDEQKNTHDIEDNHFHIQTTSHLDMPSSNNDEDGQVIIHKTPTLFGVFTRKFNHITISSTSDNNNHSTANDESTTFKI